MNAHEQILRKVRVGPKHALSMSQRQQERAVVRPHHLGRVLDLAKLVGHGDTSEGLVTSSHRKGGSGQWSLTTWRGQHDVAMTSN